MTSIEGPFIITDKKRKLELDKINRYILSLDNVIQRMMKEVIGEVNSYITFDHMVACIGLSYDGEKKEIYPIGYINNETAIIYIPVVNNSYFRATYNFISIYNKIIDEFIKANIKNIYIDMRGNSGGLIALFYLYLTRFIESPTIKLINNKGEVNTNYKKNNIYYFLDKKLYDPTTSVIKCDKVFVILNNNSFSGSLFNAFILKKNLGAVIYGNTDEDLKPNMTYMNIINTELGYIRIPTAIIADKSLEEEIYLSIDIDGYPII